MRGPTLGPRARGWLKFLWRKATTDDDWTETGEPHPWWDRYSSEPVMNFVRFDLSESAYAVAVMADLTPAWREVYGRILDELVRRHTTFWAAIDWLTQIGPDPRRAEYPQDWIDVYLPKHLIGRYDVPGWVANGVEPWGLQPDPIGADGNLFFKGWLNLLLSLRAQVSGLDRRDERFEVAGIGGTRFEWTHARLAEWLVELWRRHPEGPHCENTKVWPYCLNAAGLGLDLYDTLYGTRHHQAWERWSGETRDAYFGIEAGQLRWVTLYYDPLIRHQQTIGPSGGLANALYTLPQDHAFAELLYHGAVAKLGWSDSTRPVRELADPRFLALGRVLAAELGDPVTERRLGLHAEERFEPRAFGADESEFGWWFRLGERWPRGQLSAIMMMAEVGGRGAWTRLFRAASQARHREPTVEGVDFPRLGIARAWNDPAAGVLEVATYPATPSLAGTTTIFRVTGLAAPGRTRVRCDGQEHGRWRVDGADAIAIETDVGDHELTIHCDGAAARPGEASAASSVPRKDQPLRRSSLVLPRSRTRALSLGGVGCPCCA